MDYHAGTLSGIQLMGVAAGKEEMEEQTLYEPQ
jgi:hypothetical protein